MSSNNYFYESPSHNFLKSIKKTSISRPLSTRITLFTACLRYSLAHIYPHANWKYLRKKHRASLSLSLTRLCIKLINNRVTNREISRGARVYRNVPMLFSAKSFPRPRRRQIVSTHSGGQSCCAVRLFYLLSDPWKKFEVDKQIEQNSDAFFYYEFIFGKIFLAR